jgi:hypothetical protein
MRHHHRVASDQLNDHERALIDFAGRFYVHDGAREQAIRDLFGMSATRYWQQVNALLDRPAALAYAPVTVNRLRRLREQRRLNRSGH